MWGRISRFTSNLSESLSEIVAPIEDTNHEEDSDQDRSDDQTLKPALPPPIPSWNKSSSSATTNITTNLPPPNITNVHGNQYYSKQHPSPFPSRYPLNFEDVPRPAIQQQQQQPAPQQPSPQPIQQQQQQPYTSTFQPIVTATPPLSVVQPFQPTPIVPPAHAVLHPQSSPQPPRAPTPSSQPQPQPVTPLQPTPPPPAQIQEAIVQSLQPTIASSIPEPSQQQQETSANEAPRVNEEDNMQQTAEVYTVGSTVGHALSTTPSAADNQLPQQQPQHYQTSSGLRGYLLQGFPQYFSTQQQQQQGGEEANSTSDPDADMYHKVAALIASYEHYANFFTNTRQRVLHVREKHPSLLARSRRNDANVMVEDSPEATYRYICELCETADDVVVLQETNARLLERMGEKEEQLHKLKYDLGQMQKAKEKLEQTLINNNNNEADVLELERELSSRQIMIERLEQQLNHQNVSFQETQMHYEEEIRKISDQKAQLAAENEKLRKQLREANERFEFETESMNNRMLELQNELDVIRERDHMNKSQISSNMEQMSIKIQELKSELAEKTSMLQTSEVALGNLQNVLEQFQSERDAEVAMLKGEINNMKQEVQSAKDEAHKAMAACNELREQAEKAEKLELELQEKTKLCVSLKVRVGELQTALEETIHKFNGDNLVDRRLVIKLLITYLEGKNQNEVLDLMAKILSFTPEERERVTALKRGGLSGWLGLGGGGAPGTPNNKSNKQPESLADMWIDFLLKESGKINNNDANNKNNNNSSHPNNNIGTI